MKSKIRNIPTKYMEANKKRVTYYSHPERIELRSMGKLDFTLYPDHEKFQHYKNELLKSAGYK